MWKILLYSNKFKKLIKTKQFLVTYFVEWDCQCREKAKMAIVLIWPKTMFFKSPPSVFFSIGEIHNPANHDPNHTTHSDGLGGKTLFNDQIGSRDCPMFLTVLSFTQQIACSFPTLKVLRQAGSICQQGEEWAKHSSATEVHLILKIYPISYINKLYDYHRRAIHYLEYTHVILLSVLEIQSTFSLYYWVTTCFVYFG